MTKLISASSISKDHRLWNYEMDNFALVTNVSVVNNDVHIMCRDKQSNSWKVRVEARKTVEVLG